MYEIRDAVLFIAERTGEKPGTIDIFLKARFRYQVLNDLIEPDEDIPTAERELHADLITNRPDGPRNEDVNMLLAYVMRVTGLDRALIASLIAEEAAYLAKLGILSPNEYLVSRSWADAISKEELEAEDSAPIN